jgi:hypothetical protein
MPRRVFTLLSALSLLLCVATCVLWVRSKSDRVRQCDNWIVATARSEYWVIVQPGRFVIDRKAVRRIGDSIEYDRAPNFLDDFRGWTHHGVDPNLSRSSLWFGYGQCSTDAGTTAWAVAIPCWSMAGIFAVFPLMWVKRHWQGRGRSAGMCPSCGYDLRATPERCPECGRYQSGIGKFQTESPA